MPDGSQRASLYGDKTGRQVAEATAKQAGPKLVETWFREHGHRLDAFLPAGLTRDRMLATALAAIRKKPKLAECTVASLFAAILLCAQMGLEPDTHEGHCYLIPRSRRVKVNGKWQDGTPEVQVQLGYKGRIELAYRSPRVHLIKAVLVHEKDHFEVREGTEQTITHTPFMHGDPGPKVAVYAICALDTGKALFEVLRRHEVERIRDENSDAYVQARANLANAETDRDRARASDTPWISDEGQMWRKTAINRLHNYIPVSREAGIASTIESNGRAAAELGDMLEGHTTIDAGPAEEDDPEDAAQQSDAPPADSQPKQENAPLQIAHEQTIPVDLGGAPREAAETRETAETRQKAPARQRSLIGGLD